MTNADTKANLVALAGITAAIAHRHLPEPCRVHFYRHRPTALTVARRDYAMWARALTCAESKRWIAGGDRHLYTLGYLDDVAVRIITTEPIVAAPVKVKGRSA